MVEALLLSFAVEEEERVHLSSFEEEEVAVAVLCSVAEEEVVAVAVLFSVVEEEEAAEGEKVPEIVWHLQLLDTVLEN